jgi:hypothetical protein
LLSKKKQQLIEKKIQNLGLTAEPCSGVFSTGATGAIAPAILSKRLIAPAILHLPYSVIIFGLKKYFRMKEGIPIVPNVTTYLKKIALRAFLV